MILMLCFSFLLSPALQAAEQTPLAAEVIENPYKQVWAAEEGEVSGLNRFFLDLNGDGRPDLFIAGTAMVGNGGAPYEAFLALEKGYRHVGRIFLADGSFQLLKKKTKGLRDIKVCTHVSAEECMLRTYVFDGTRYQAGTERPLPASRFKKEITPTPIQIEKSGKPLTWTP